MKIRLYIIGGICSGFAGAAAFTALDTWMQNPITNYYETEVAVSVSPHTIKTALDKGDASYVVVDLRTVAEYETEHWIGSINIPGSLSEQEIIQKFKELPKGKKVVVFCYSAYCTLATKVGKLLAESDIYVSHLNVGWYELRYGWQLWEGPTAKDIDLSKYIISGSAPGAVEVKQASTSCTAGTLGGC